MGIPLRLGFFSRRTLGRHGGRCDRICDLFFPVRADVLSSFQRSGGCLNPHADARKLSRCSVGATVQNIFTSLKLLGILLLISGTISGTGHAMSLQPVQKSNLSFAQFSGAMVVCIFAYNGWFVVGMVGAEITHPQRNLPRAIILGVGIVIVLYFLINIGFLTTLTIEEIAGSKRVAESAATRTMGTIGSTFVTLTILASTFGAANSTIMTGARVYFAQARDGLFLRPFAHG